MQIKHNENKLFFFKHGSFDLHIMHLAPAILPTTRFFVSFDLYYRAEGRDELAKNDREGHKEKGGHEDRK
jgi:hypothetical protein